MSQQAGPFIDEDKLSPSVEIPDASRGRRPGTTRGCPYRVMNSPARDLPTTSPPESVGPILKRLSDLAYEVQEHATGERFIRAWNRRKRTPVVTIDCNLFKPTGASAFAQTNHTSTLKLVPDAAGALRVYKFVLRFPLYDPEETPRWGAAEYAANLVADVTPPLPDTWVFRYIIDNPEPGDSAPGKVGCVHIENRESLLHPTVLLDFLAEYIPRYRDRFDLPEAPLSSTFDQGVDVSPIGTQETPAHPPVVDLLMAEGGREGPSGYATGPVAVVTDAADALTVDEGDILVAETLSAAAGDAVERAAGVVLEGERVPRSIPVNGTPTVVGIEDAAARFTDAQIVCIDAHQNHVSRPIRQTATNYTGESVKLCSGIGASPGDATGTVHHLSDASRIHELEPGDILAAETTSPEMVPAMGDAAGIITERGGMGSHAAIVAREFGIPAVVATGDALDVLTGNQVVTIDGDAGTVHGTE